MSQRPISVSRWARIEINGLNSVLTIAPNGAGSEPRCSLLTHLPRFGEVHADRRTCCVAR
jgi:hypothetical protein